MIDLIWLYPLSFLFLFLKIRNKKENIVYTLLVLMYFLSSVAAVYLHSYDFWYSTIQIMWYAVIFHLFFTLLILTSYKNIEIKFKSIPPVQNSLAFSVLTWIIIVLGISSIIINIPKIDLTTMLYYSKELRVFETDGERGGFIDYIAFFGSRYYSLALVMAFYYIINYPKKKFIIIILLLCSLTIVVSGMIVAAREYIIKYLYLIGIMFLLYRKKLPKIWKKSLMISGVVFATLGILMFLFISYARFGDTIGRLGDEATKNSLIEYYGQGWINFSLLFDMFSAPLLPIGALHFPFFSSGRVSMFNLNDVINANFSLNVFATSLGSWMQDGGVLFAACISILLASMIRFIQNRRPSVYNVYYLIWFYDYAFSYLFFFNDIFTGSRVLSVLVIVFFDFIDTHSTHKNHFYKNVTLPYKSR